ncbi:flagellar motor protein MotB [Acidisoma sp.]|uniref:flagellar motor protein MotB n=1 Tax=Acidisoma sp. TaxID=1872115 RepID=UPI003B001A5C
MSSGHGGPEEKKKPNHERWVISYADLMTLLLALFVVLYASSTQNKFKMQEEVRSLVAAFRGSSPSVIQLHSSEQGIMHHQPSPVPKPLEHPAPQVPHLPKLNTRPAPQAQPNLSPRKVQEVVHQPAAPATPATPPPVPLPPQPPLNYQLSQQLAAEAMSLERVREQLEALLQTQISKHEVTIDSTPLTLTISLEASVLFNSGRATLLPAASKLLAHVSTSLNTLPEPFTIHLDGHTDNQPIRTAQFPSNWSLSVERAVSVTELFVEQGLDGRRLAAEGFGQYAPIAENSTAAGRSKNRRVVIVIRAPDVKNP